MKLKESLEVGLIADYDWRQSKLLYSLVRCAFGQQSLRLNPPAFLDGGFGRFDELLILERAAFLREGGHLRPAVRR